MKLKTLRLLAVIAALVGFAHMSGALSVLEADVVRILNSSGAMGWRIKVDSGNDLVFQNVDTAHSILPLNDLTIDQATGGVRFPGYTTTQLATLAAPATGYVVWNTSLNTGNSHTGGYLMVSTGSAAGSWTLY